MTKRHFTIFAEVCRQMSFSKAAEALNTTQPTVSLAVKELEEHYGVRLFERMNRRIYMTEAGRALLSTAQEVLRLSAGGGPAAEGPLPAAGGGERHFWGHPAPQGAGPVPAEVPPGGAFRPGGKL